MGAERRDPGSAFRFVLNRGGVTVPIRQRWTYRADFRWYEPQAEWPRSWRVFSGFGSAWAGSPARE